MKIGVDRHCLRLILILSRIIIHHHIRVSINDETHWLNRIFWNNQTWLDVVNSIPVARNCQEVKIWFLRNIMFYIFKTSKIIKIHPLSLENDVIKDCNQIGYFSFLFSQSRVYASSFIESLIIWGWLFHYHPERGVMYGLPVPYRSEGSPGLQIVSAYSSDIVVKHDFRNKPCIKIRSELGVLVV